MVYESVVEETIISLLQNKGYELIDENDHWVAYRSLDEFINKDLLLGEEFKKDNSKYKIAIVCDMWLTGFDVPDLDVMYFIKRLKSYNLMQAIARVNRVYPGKFYGLIVDHIGLGKALDDALTEYTDRDRENNCQDIKKEIYNILKEKLSVLNEWFYKIDKSKFYSKDSLTRFTSIQEGTQFI